MPSLLVAWDTTRRLLPLAATGLVGRAPACLVRIDHPACPAHWLEIRWTGACWAWRPLAAAERTRGAGRPLADGWTSLEVGEDRGTRIALGADAWVEIVDDGPPAPFAWDVLDDRPLEDAALEEVAEVRGDQLLPLAAEGDDGLALRDGQCWVHTASDGARTLRAHVPVTMAATAAPRIDLARGEVFVLVDLSTLRATLRQGPDVATVEGACVRTLVVYGNARDAHEGWLTAAEAWAEWTELGGQEERAIDAVAWERARLRRLLDRARVGGLDRLFESRKDGTYVKTRLGTGIEVDVVG